MNAPIDPASMNARRAARYAEQGARNEAYEEDARRERFRTLLIAAVACVTWCIVGLAGIGLGLASTVAEYASIWFWGGLVVGNGGILVTLIWTAEKLRSQGDQG